MDQEGAIVSVWKWTAQRERAALLLADGMTYREIEANHGIAHTTIARWKKEPEFLARIDQHLDEAVSEARRVLRRNALAAAQQIVNLHAHGHAQHTVKLAATKDILDRVGLKAPEKHEYTISAAAAAQLSDEELDAEIERRKLPV